MREPPGKWLSSGGELEGRLWLPAVYHHLVHHCTAFSFPQLLLNNSPQNRTQSNLHHSQQVRAGNVGFSSMPWQLYTYPWWLSDSQTATLEFEH